MPQIGRRMQRMSGDFHGNFDALSRKLALARTTREHAYFRWTAACAEVKRLEREQSAVWGQMLDSVTVGLPEAKKTL